MGLLDGLFALGNQGPKNPIRNATLLPQPSQPELRTQYPYAYGLLGGLAGTAPDEMGGSVLDPQTARVQQGAKVGFPLSVVAALSPLTKGMSVGASTKNVGAPLAQVMERKPFVYPRQAVLDTAQKNAALPVEQGGLGLRPDNTPMERARALGHDMNQFHETTAENAEGIAANGFDPRRPVAAAADQETPYGVFTKMDGGSIKLAKDGEVQMPLLVRQGNVEMFKDRGVLTSNVGNTNPELKSLWQAIHADEQSRASQIDALGEMMGTRAHPNTSGMSNADLWRKIDALAEGDGAQYAKAKSLLTDEFKNRGVDTVMLLNDAGSMGRKATTSISLNPANVRSRFAAFDPMRRNENDLLGRADPALLGIIGAGGLLGLGAYNSK